MGLLQILKNRSKVLGINERNLRYIRPYNLVRSKRIADDKMMTKRILTKYDIPTPKLIASIGSLRELENFDWNILPNGFVLKPVTGLEGGGIQIFYNRDREGNWIRADKSRASVNEIKDYCSSILDGKYSLHNTPDRVMFEERVKIHPRFKLYAYKGAPDVRIIVFNNIPVMSYIRLPTKESDGKANLALGAIAAAIDMSTGVTTNAVQGKTRAIDYLPGTKFRLSGIPIPYWNRILKYSIEAQRATGLGFAAVDFLIDRELGPLIVELNARPGLSIQIANRDGLKWRLEKAKGVKVKTVEKGMRLGRDLFGGEIEEEVENITGKQVIGIVEWVTLFGKEGQEERVKAKIDTGALITSIDTKLAEKLGFKNALDFFDSFHFPLNLTTQEAKDIDKKYREKLLEHPDIVDLDIVHSSHGTTYRPSVELLCQISEFKFNVKVNVVDRSRLIYSVIIGRRDLTKFIIDASKKFKGY